MNINKYNFRTDLACDEKDCVSNRLLETIETFNNIEVYKHIVNDDANLEKCPISPLEPFFLYDYSYELLLKFYGDKETTDRIWDEIQFCKQMHQLRPHQDEYRLEILEKVLKDN